MKKMFHGAALFLLLALLNLQLATVHAQGTAFTYQGRLNTGGSPATGSYDLAFTLYTTNVTGGIFAGPVTNKAVAVTNGLFTTTVDFGNAYTGTSNWLEIAVSTNAANTFTTLNPRQQLTPVPYAITAANVSGTISASALPSTVVTNNGTGVTLNGTFKGNANGLTNFSLSSLPVAVVTNNESGVTLNGAFSGNGSGLTGLSASALPSTVVINNETGVTLSGTFSGNGSGLTNVPGTEPWQMVSGTSQTATANQGYLLTNNAADTVTLPTIANVGDIVTVSGTGTNGWSAMPGLGQAIAGPLLQPAGVTWVLQASYQNWYSVASSADGTHLVAAASGGYLYTSTNSGVIWTKRTTINQNWASVASSADGTHLVAAVYGGYLYTSTNSGGTWTQQNSSGSTNWQSVASSADGTHLVAAVNGGYLYTSTNSGVTWTQRTSSGSENWYSLASSADGTHLVAGVDGGYLYTSTNSGVTWTQQDGNNYEAWVSVASSADGTHLVAAAAGYYIYTSTDSGVTWTPQTSSGTPFWVSVASSADGTHLVAAALPGYIYTSTDSGVTWTPQTSNGNQNWISVASSADGTHLVAAVTGGYLFTSQPEFAGTAGSTVQFFYQGNGVWQPLEEPSSQFVGTILTSQLSGTLTTAQLPSSVVTNNETGVTLSGTFTGNGSGLTNLDVSVADTSEDLRLLRGLIKVSTTNILAGSGFILTKNGTGDYTIIYTTAFNGFAFPNLTVQSAAYPLIPNVVTTTSDLFEVRFYNSLGTLTDPDYFGFTVAGGR